jgi:hypothetical protein
MTLLIPDIRAQIFKLLIDSKESVPPAYVACAEIFKQFLRSRNRVGKGLSYRPVRPAKQPGGIGSLKSILGLLKSLKIRAGTTTLFLLGS